MPGIPIEHIEDVWHIVSRQFENAEYANDGTFDIDELKTEIMEGNKILWMGRNTKVSVILEVLDYPKGKQCDIVSLVGEDLNTWIRELEEIEDFALRAGCIKMCLTGRKAWEKILPDYSIKTVNMVKELCQ